VQISVVAQPVFSNICIQALGMLQQISAKDPAASTIIITKFDA